MKALLDALVPLLPGLHIAAEIAILFGIIYSALFYLRKTRGMKIIVGFLVVWLALSSLAVLGNFAVISYFFEHISTSLVVILIVLFQSELRRFFAKLASRRFFRGRKQHYEMINEVVAACVNMSQNRCGALIVIDVREELQAMIDDGTPLDAKVSAPLLESIFYPGTPLHDGAVVIRDNRIVAAQVFLPLSRSTEISSRLGTRHRAALGISEESEAVTIVVSEETGSISLAHDNEFIRRGLTGDELKSLLENITDAEELKEAAKSLDETAEKIGESAPETPSPKEEEQ